MKGLSNYPSCSCHAACLYVVHCILAALIVGVDERPSVVGQNHPLDGGVHPQEGGEGCWGNAWVSRSCWCNLHLQESGGLTVLVRKAFLLCCETATHASKTLLRFFQGVARVYLY